MANYQIKRTVGEHYEDTSYSSAKKARTYLKQFVAKEEEEKAKAKNNEKVEKKKEEKTKPEKIEKKKEEK